MARRSGLPMVLRPAALIRSRALYRGVFGPSTFWKVIAAIVFGTRALRRVFGRRPEVIEIATMKGGGHWMHIATFDKTSRRARRR